MSRHSEPAISFIRSDDCFVFLETLTRHFPQWVCIDQLLELIYSRSYEGCSLTDVFDAVVNLSDVYLRWCQARFTAALLRDMAKVPFPDDHIFSQTVSGRPKSEVLLALESRHPGAEAYHFIEDKLSTLEKVSQSPNLMN